MVHQKSICFQYGNFHAIRFQAISTNISVDYTRNIFTKVSVSVLGPCVNIWPTAYNTFLNVTHDTGLHTLSYDQPEFKTSCRRAAATICPRPGLQQKRAAAALIYITVVCVFPTLFYTKNYSQQEHAYCLKLFPNSFIYLYDVSHCSEHVKQKIMAEIYGKFFFIQENLI